MEDTETVFLLEKDGLHQHRSYKVVQVFIKCAGGPVYSRQRICELDLVEDSTLSTNGQPTKSKTSTTAGKGKCLIKSSVSGTVAEILLHVGQTVSIGSPILRVTVCKHPTMLGNMCGDCGVTFEEDEGVDEDGDVARAPLQHKTVSMLHSMPNVRVTVEEAKRLGTADRVHLLESQKLVLLVDLDQTLLHTTNDNVPLNIKDVHHFRLHPHGPVYYCRLRPYTRQFLASVSQYYELHICTFGVREYAHVIARYLDPDGKLFQQRILSRNECLDPMSKKANLKSLFPCGDELVCIMDDRSDVWHFASNVVQVLPYHFFQHTGDINAPPGLQKKENDTSHTGFDFSVLSEDVTPTGKRKTENKRLKDQNTKQPRGDMGKKLDRDKTWPGALQQPGSGGGGSSSSSTTYSDDESNSVASEESPTALNTAGANSSPISSESNADTTVKQSIDIEETVSNEKHFCIKSDDESCGSKPHYSQQVLSKDNDVNSEPKIEDDETSTASASDDMRDKRKKDNTEAIIVENNLSPNTSKTDLDSSSKELPFSEGESTFKESAAQTEKHIETAETKDISLDGPNAEMEADDHAANGGSTRDNAVDVPDHDDYLLHLEDILKKIHREFYARYQKTESSRSPRSEDSNERDARNLPDLKWLVPEIRGNVLKGCNITFSSVVPQNSDLSSSKAYGIAVSLGARVVDDLQLPPRNGATAEQGSTLYTTHLVAANPHTQKVHQARRCKSVMVVTPDWLWCCMERWEKVEELLFPLTPSATITRNPPHHCCAPYILPNTSRQNSLDLYFMEDKAKERMMEEVKELLEGDDDDDEPDDGGSEGNGSSDEKSSGGNQHKKRTLEHEEDSSCSNDDSNTGDSSRLSGKRDRRKRRKRNYTRKLGPPNDGGLYDDDENSNSHDINDDGDELPSVKFRRGEAVKGVKKDSEDGGDSSSNSSDMEALDSGEEERLLRMEQELMDF